MTWVTRDELRGPVGTFDSVTAVELPYGEAAYATIGGTPANRTVTFGIPRGQVGLPGVNAVANDAAIAGAIGTDLSATQGALNSRYTVRRVWTGSAYPPRVSGASNIFIGPTDPGLAMDPDEDVWANPDAITLADVEAEAVNPASNLYEAIVAAAPGGVMFLPFSLFDPVSSAVPTKSWVGVGPYVAGWSFGDSAQSRAGAVFRTPIGWNSIRLTILQTHGVNGATGDVRWEASAAQLPVGALFTGASSVRFGTGSVGAQYTVSTAVITESGGAVAVDPAGGYMRLTVTRRTDSAADTTTAAVLLLGVLVERMS